jgi:tripartite-type tricarboxylate transporter receptor subunit TctC
MRIDRIRRAAAVAGLIIGLSAAAVGTGGETWPQRPVRLVVPVGVGSGPDVAARLYGQRLAALWKQPVFVENRPGADGLVGVSAYIAMHDDHALLFSPAAPISVFPYIHDKLTYDAARDLMPISTATDTFGAIAVPASLNVGSLTEVVALARQRPGKLNWASGGGAFPILFGAFVKGERLDIVEIAYREQNVAIQDLAEGRVQIIATTLTPLLPLVQAGKVRILAVTNKRRAPIAPNVPTVVEAGHSELAFEGLVGFFGGRNMPAAVRDRVAADVAFAASDPVLVQRLAEAGQAVRTSAPADFASAIEQQRAHVEALVRFIKQGH